MGLNDYTGVDVPIIITAQAIFLLKTLGPDVVTLPGERHQKRTIRIETPNWFLNSAEKHGMVDNIDLLVEVDESKGKKPTFFLFLNEQWSFCQ